MAYRTLTGNIILNFAGQAVPFAAVAACMPLLARTLGLERLGLLSLAWVLIGSFGLLDLGMGRALTQTVAAALATNRSAGVRTLLVSGTALLFAVGTAGAIALGALGSWLVDHYFQISPDLRHEAIAATYLLAAGLPFMMASSAQRGFLEAHQRFDLVNFVRAPISALNYIGPVAALPFSHSTALCVAIIVATRVAACLAYAAMCISLLPGEPHAGFRWKDSIDFVRAAMWMTMANLAGAALAYADRFVLTGAVSVTALAYYATPQEIVTRLTVLPMTAGAVVFPAFSAASALRTDQGTRLFEKMSLFTFACLLPVCLMVSAFAPYWLTLWMGREFAIRSSTIAQLFCFGTFMNSMAVTPALFLQASGRADLAARIQCIELPAYLVSLWLAALRFGIGGVAFVWVARAWIDAGLLYLTARPLLTQPSAIIRVQSRLILAATGTFFMILWSPGLILKILVLSVSLLWLTRELPRLMFEEDRSYAVSVWKKVRSIITG